MHISRASSALAWSTLSALLLSACAQTPGREQLNPMPDQAIAGPALSSEAERSPARPGACPEGLPASVRCLFGQDSAGAHYLLAVPSAWNGTLVVHAHGGPNLRPSEAARAAADLQRWKVWVESGHAYAGISFSRAGFEVTSAAHDLERVRQAFSRHVGLPKRTVLHGQSWGAAVALKALESPQAADRYQAALLTAGVVAPSSSAYDLRWDLRVVYQAYCGNHPKPEEPAYPLWLGLPRDSSLTQADLDARVRECLGIGIAAAQRSPDQSARLRDLLAVMRIPESSVLLHLRSATFTLSHLVQHTLQGRSIYGNDRVRYNGSGNDEALNARVLRYAHDPQAKAEFRQQADFLGRLTVPTLSLHSRLDSTVFVEQQHSLKLQAQERGFSHLLAQAYTTHRDHSYMADDVYVAAMAALLDWAGGGRKPTPKDLLVLCQKLTPASGPESCDLDLSFEAPPMHARVAPR